MGKAHRSPLLGYNHNVGHLGRVFHVQTEDSGPVLPRLFTHLFHEGIILASRKSEYEALLAEDKVRALMQGQHRQVIKDLAGGLFNERIITFFRARGVELVVPAVVMQGALPSAPMASDTSGAAVVPAPPAPPAPPSPVAEPEVPVSLAAAPVPASAPRRNTRPIEAQRSRKVAAPPIAVRPPDPRRPPFVRSGAPAVAKTTSADGVVVQRSVVIGGVSTGDARPRIRPPVPYIVTGGSHPVRQPGSAVTAKTAEKPVSAPVSPSTSGSAPISAVEVPPRAAGVFGQEDKSLDEVILEYLSEDGD